jgi:hypothetical protein
MRAAGGTEVRTRAASPAAPDDDGRPARPAWSLPFRARVLVVAGVLVAAAGVFVAVFWVHGVWVPLCSGARAGCGVLRRDERLAIRALVIAAGVAWAAGLGSLALLASRPGVARHLPLPALGLPARFRARRGEATGAGRRSGAAHARGG